MKQLELTPPLLLITMGYPGAGKTFFSRQFAEQYKLPLISEDRVRYELFEKPLFNEDEQDIIGRILEYSLEQIMTSRATVICDGLFSTPTSRKRLYDLAHKNGYRTLIVWLQTDAVTSFGRAKQRDRRNPDSKYSFPIDQSLFKTLSAAVTRPSDKEQSVVISGKHAFKGQSLTVLRRITEMYANGISPTPSITGHNVRPIQSGARKPRQLIQ